MHLVLLLFYTIQLILHDGTRDFKIYVPVSYQSPDELN